MKNNLFYLVLFIIILAISRIIPHPPNFTPIIATSILGPLLLKSRLYGMMVPVLITDSDIYDLTGEIVDAKKLVAASRERG